MSSFKRWMSGLFVSALAGCGPIDAATPDTGMAPGVEPRSSLSSTATTAQSLVAPPPTLHLGVFRQESGGYYLWAGVSWTELEAKAQELKVPFGWQLKVVPGVAHNPAGCVADAAKALFP